MGNPYHQIRTREIYRNPWICVREDEVRRPDGAVASFGIVEMKPGASVLAINEHGECYLVREFKYAVGRETLEVVSGGIEAGETPLEAARRELREEAGLEAAQWVPLGFIDPFTSVVSSPNHLFLALGVREGERRPDAGEFLSIKKVLYPQALEMVSASEITHAASTVLILQAARRIDGRR